MFSSRLLVPGLLFVLLAGQDDQVLGQVPGRGTVRPDIRGVLKSVDAAAGKITVQAQDGRQGPSEKTYNLAKEAEIVLGSGGDRVMGIGAGAQVTTGPSSVVRR